MTTERHRFPVYLAGITGLALIAIALLCWATGSPNPLAVADDNFGRSLLFLPQPAAHLVLGAVGALALVAVVLRRSRLAGVAAVGALALLLDSSVLGAIGYLPFMAFSALTGHVDRLGVYLSPSLLAQVGIAAAAASLLWVQVSRATSAAGQDPAAHERAAVRTRRWTKIAMEAPLIYAATRVLMALQVPGFDLPMERDAVLAGLGLAVAATGGAVLTWGLIRPWGERFPRWIPGAAGRPVPVNLAVVPALTVAVLVLAASKVVLTMLFAETGIGLEHVLVWLPMFLWPLWSVALALAAVNYKIRRSADQRSAMMV
ncbi:hypothetical protein AB0I53_20940 [Saccharopolyspora sp. NPDC050389]|uniref:hypothetical protein n=1 Tax=Saccharopolyspora sp. NPDC050389 TaxID=3155516 RepID=UPI0034116A07